MGTVKAGEITLLVFGDARIVTPIREIDPSAEMIFAAGIYLILERERPTPRRTLQTLLWPDVDSETGAHRLRQTLLKLRQIGVPIGSDGKSRISLKCETVSVEHEALESSGIDQHGLAKLGRQLFSGYTPNFSAPFQDWLDGRKDQITARISQVLLGYIAIARLGGNWPDVELYAKSLLQHAPFNEEATLALAESLAMRGEKIRGVRILDQYLAEVGNGPSDLRMSASIMRRRIADRMPPRDHHLTIDSPLVGREAHLADLAELLRSADNRRPGSAMLWGDPGIGKSRLLTEFLSFASLQGAAWHRVTCRSTDSSRSLAVLLELLPLLRGMRGAIGSAPETLRFLDVLTTHRPKREANPEKGASELAHIQLDRPMLDILGAVTEDNPLIVAIEDCHWMDQASASAFSSIIQRLSDQRLLLIFTSRQTEIGDPLVAGVTTELKLPALDETQSREVIDSIARQRGRRISSRHLNWCIVVAEGNPYFLHELANHWLESGNEHNAPRSLTTILRQRIARLSQEALQLLQACSLLENHSSLDNLESLLAFPAHTLIHCIDELSAAGMVAFSAADPCSRSGGLLRSKHDLLSETALMQLSIAARAYMHRLAAKVLEQRINEHGEASTLWSCAKHWWLAGDLPEALRLATSCANHLLEVGLPSDAADAFEKALQYCDTDSDLLSTLECQATAYFRSSDWERLSSTIASARVIQRKINPTTSIHDELELMLLRANWQTLNWNDILTQSVECLSSADADAAHRVDAGVMALMMVTFAGDRQRGLKIFSTIQALASDPSVRIESLLKAQMIYHTNWGSFEEAISAANDLVACQEASGEIAALFQSLCNASVTFRAAGLVAEASQHLTTAVELADRHHLHLSKSRAIPMLANLYLEQGDLEQARYWLGQLEELHIAAEDILGREELSAISTRIALLEGRPEDAHTLFAEQLAQFGTDEVPHRRAYIAALRVAVELSKTGTASRASLDDLEGAHLQSRGNVFQAFASFALHAGLCSVGESSRADVLLDDYLTKYRREPWPAPSHLLESIRQTGTPRKPLGLISVQSG